MADAGERAGDSADTARAEPSADKAEESKPPVLLSLDILRVIGEAQQQHGLRHGDYQRYRGYCSRRVRRLRKVLRLPQGDRRHYRRRDVTAAHLAAGAGARLLCVPLVQAERAWAHAMQLRQEANTEPRKRFHLVQRLRKAAAHAHALLQLAESGACCARTQLEAQAYSAALAGALRLELQQWAAAQDDLARAQLVYSQLAAALPLDERALYLQKVEELKPSLRYCAYNIGDESAAEELRDLRARGLLHNLDALAAQAKEARSGALQEVEWRGRRATVRPERVRLFLVSLQQLEPALEAAPSLSARIELLDAALADCKEAASAVRDDLKADPKLKSADWLLAYLTHLRLTHTVRRNNLLVQQAEDARRRRVPLDGKKVRARDLARLYEIILQNYAELQALAGLETDADYQRELRVHVLAYRALRCFHIAQALVGLRRWREALALLERSAACAHDALAAAPAPAAHLPPELADKLRALHGDIDSCRFEVHANSVLEADEEAGEEARASARSARDRKPLAERLDELRDEPAALTRNPNVYKLPPPMEAIPCKPLFFDLACNLVEFPALRDESGADTKRSAAGLTGLVKGFLGWGARD